VGRGVQGFARRTNWAHIGQSAPASGPGFQRKVPTTFRESVLYSQPTGPDPLYHRDDKVARPRAMRV